RNKINHVLRTASVIQTIDNVDLLHQVAQRVPAGDTCKVMIQVNTSAEESKFGCDPDTAVDLALEAAETGGIALTGLMTIGLNSLEEAPVRRSYRRLAEIREDCVAQLGTQAQGSPLELSMG